MTPSRVVAARPRFTDDDVAEAVAAIADVLKSGRLILGPRLEELEAAFARKTGVRHAVAVGSCGAALQIAYRHVGVSGREVIVPTNTFAATATSVLAAGGTPVFCDMSEDYGLDVDDALSRVTPRTAAIVAVHVAGFVVSGMARLRSECERRGVALIEDCAHAHGAGVPGQIAGSLGLAGCFSFYPTKVLTCGTGGMLTTDDDALAAFARSMRHHGQGTSIEEIVREGQDWVLDEVRCVLALSQLRHLDEFVASRRQSGARYSDLLRGDARVELPRPEPGPVYYKFPLLLPEGVDRDAVRRSMLTRHGVEAGTIYWPPCHLMPVFRERLGTGPGMLPKAEARLARHLTLPLWVGLAPEEIERSVAALDEALQDQGFHHADRGIRGVLMPSRHEA